MFVLIYDRTKFWLGPLFVVHNTCYRGTYPLQLTEEHEATSIAMPINERRTM
jgi:hypothetical protein